MQDQRISFWTTPILAFCLSLLLSVTLAPALGLVDYQQYDFWLFWVFSMLILALPFTILEIALAKRAQSTPLQAFVKLTREADRSTRWRLIGWASVVFVPFLAGGILEFAAQHVDTQFALPFSHSILLLICAVIAVALSLLPRMILFIALFVATLAVLIIGVLSNTVHTWQWTPFELKEWAKVVTLTLVTGGLGLGLYWQNAVNAVKTEQKALPVVLPIWLAQVLGLGAFIFVSNVHSNLHAVVLLIAALILAGIFLQYIREQFLERQTSIVIQAIILLLPILVWAIPQATSTFYSIVIIFGLLLCFAHAVFAGWLMKISHLRKSINFSSEASYNIWRVLIRIIVPLSIILAVIGWIMALTGV
ncbi:MAG: hypothetical protein LKF82_04540 [Acinetobacter populi]|jgi:hypothetical protein|uniref:hypothetical protein n=1 Tax=Acinetobacter populi TaxID=1582270 RepID=UPI0023537D48|nr:hypothetical protein [Acinetobacter populi]MCH4247093.1 hypothetical protein [Acinetobacter populi]